MKSRRPPWFVAVLCCTVGTVCCSPAGTEGPATAVWPHELFTSAQADTLPQSLRWPVPSAGERPPHPPRRGPRTARLLFAGDVMQHAPQLAAARRSDGSYDFGLSFACIRPLFEAADLTVVNLETTLADTGPYKGYPRFRSPAALADALREAGVDVCVLANNHCFDGGAEGVRTTLAALDRCGMGHTGLATKSTAQERPLVTEAGGIRFALLAYTYGTNGIAAPPGTAVARIDTAVMRRDLRQARRLADCIVVMVHWGNEYDRRPDAGQRRLAAFLRDNGADLVIGSHPHVVQPFETDSSGAVFYSLGNLVSNQRRLHSDGGIVARVTVVVHDDGALRCSADALPVWVQLPHYRILPPEAADTAAMRPDERAAYLRFVEETRQTLGSHGA